MNAKSDLPGLKMIKKCDRCGKLKTSQGPLCRQCYRDSVARKYSFVCNYCSNTFTPKSPIYSKYCSTICNNSAKAKRKQEHLNQKRAIKEKGKICQVCGIIFHPPSSRQIICSKECRIRKRRAGYEQAKIIRNKRNKTNAKPKNIRECHECGKMFIPEYGTKLRLFCSNKCQKKNTRRNREHNRRFRMRKQKGDHRVYKQRIYLRDGGKCQICGKKVIFDRIVPHPYSPTLDHIIPLSMGGIHKPENVQLAHFRCNVKKKNKISDKGNQLFLFG